MCQVLTFLYVIKNVKRKKEMKLQLWPKMLIIIINIFQFLIIALKTFSNSKFPNKLKFTHKKLIKGSNVETINNSAVNNYDFIDLYILVFIDVC